MNDATDDSRHAPIAHAISESIAGITTTTTVDRLEELLVERNLSSLPVVDDDGRLVGKVELLELLRVYDRGERPQTAAELMTPEVFALPATCSIQSALHVMAVESIECVAVIGDDGRLAGVVTAGDMIRCLRGARRARAPGSERGRRTEADRLVSVGFLAGGVAHQINNALTSMRLSLGRLTSFELSRRPMTPEVLHRIELLQDVREGVSRIERVIRELRAFSHMEDGPSRPVNIADLLASAVNLAIHQISHRATLVADYGPTPLVRATPAELRQVFVSLLVNATQAMLDGEAHVNEIRVTTRTDDRGRAVVEIADTGAGIPADVLGRIYEPFFTTRHDTRLGLGLAVSRDIVRSLEGEIDVASVVGKGTTVRVALPSCDEAAIPAPATEASRESSARDDRRRILIVDDDRPVAAAIALELSSHDVVVAESGREALEILRRDRGFDMILCDVMMPEVSGIDVYEALRLMDPGLLRRLVMMTGGAFSQRAREFLASIDAPVIEKPFEPGQLHAIVSTLERRQSTPVSAEPRTSDRAHPTR
jgi:signal transduction histidine kinase/ActR/RegA family two-component response regulator